MLMRRNGSSQNPLPGGGGGVQQGEGKGVDGAAGNANPAGCREAWQQEKRLQGQGADPRDWEGSTCRNHSGSSWVLPLLWCLCSIRELEDVCPWKSHWEGQ